MMDDPLRGADTIFEQAGPRAQLWLRVLRAALRVPGVRVDRRQFLLEQLTLRCGEEAALAAVETRPVLAGIERAQLDRIAEGVISKHVSTATVISFGTGLPGGWWMLATVPTDVAQFYAQAIILAQKLAYLYGWPDLMEEDLALDDETLLKITVFVGVMMGSARAASALSNLAQKVAQRVAVEAPERAFATHGLFALVQQIAKWIGIRLTKSSFRRFVAKAIPLLGGALSGGLTYISFRPMAMKLQRHLQSLPLAMEGDTNIEP